VYRYPGTIRAKSEGTSGQAREEDAASVYGYTGARQANIEGRTCALLLALCTQMLPALCAKNSRVPPPPAVRLEPVLHERRVVDERRRGAGWRRSARPTPGTARGLGPDRYCSPHHRMPFLEKPGFTMRWMTWRALFAGPYRGCQCGVGGRMRRRRICRGLGMVCVPPTMTKMKGLRCGRRQRGNRCGAECP